MGRVRMADSQRLYRSRTDRIITGVCGGLAEYLNIDVTLVRAIFILLAFLAGIGLLAYIVLALTVPDEGSQARGPLGALQENLNDLAVGARDLASGQPGVGTAGSDVEAAARRGVALGLILAMLGLFILLGNLGILEQLFRVVLPLTLIILGFLIIWRGRR